MTLSTLRLRIGIRLSCWITKRLRKAGYERPRKNRRTNLAGRRIGL